LRQYKHLSGTKEGCAEGDCGACTVAVLDPDETGSSAWRAVNSCLMLVPSLQGRSIVTVEGLSSKGNLHPAQEAMVQRLGSQCGYCTPGFVMSIFEGCYRDDLDSDWKRDDQLCGNLCRCTGYRPIRDALQDVAGTCPAGIFKDALQEEPGNPSLVFDSHGQHFSQPTSLDALWNALDAHPDYRLVCGATDLGLEVTKRNIQHPCLISLSGIDALRQFSSTPSTITIGATLPLSALERLTETHCIPIARMLRYFASRQIKNRATVGGNLCNASPIGDLAPILMALGASVVLASRNGDRRLPLDSFFLDYRKTDLKKGEILAKIEVPQIKNGQRVAAYKVSKRRELDISAVAAGMSVMVDENNVVSEICLAYGGMAATTARAKKTEAALLGMPWTQASVAAAQEQLKEDFQPLTDHRGSAWYRLQLAKNILLGFFLETQDDPVPHLPERPSGTVRPGEMA